MYRQLYHVMARYKIIEPQIKEVAAGKQNAGTKYLVAKLQNTLCIWEEPQTFTCFIAPIVNMFAPLLSIQHGGTSQADQPIPEELAYVTGCWIDWCPPQKFYKQHLSDHAPRPATATRPAQEAIKAGSLVMKGGKPILYTTLRIFCQYYLDEFGEKQWIRGGSPEEVGQRAFSAYCVPAEEDKTPQAMPTAPNTEIVGGKAVQTAPAPQAQPTFVQQPQGTQPLPY